MKEKVPNETKPITVQVRDFITGKPFIANALQKEIVNYTALARIIKKEIKTGSVEAIKTAIIREKGNIEKRKALREEKILNILKGTKINLQDKISVITSKKELSIPHTIAADLGDRFVYIVDQTKDYNFVYVVGQVQDYHFDEKKEINLDADKNELKVEKDLVALILKSPREIEDIPGVIAFISQVLANRNININQFISCDTDTIVVLKLGDALEAFSLMQKYI